MQRIDGATASQGLTAPAATSGTPGYFSEGDVATSTPATRITGDFLNMVQEELVAVVRAAGYTPDKANWTQVRDAIQSLIAQAVANGATPFASDAETQAGQITTKATSPHGVMTAINTAVANAINALIAGAPDALNTLKELADAVNDDQNFAASVTAALAARAMASRQIGVTGGLLTGGGDLTGDRQIGLKKASVADFAAKADDCAITPAILAALFASSGAGSITLPDGRILKYGGAALTNNTGWVRVVFDQAFPNRCVRAFANNDCGSYNPAAPSSAVAWAATGGFAADGFWINMPTASGTAAAAGTAAHWWAIGE